MFQNSAFCEGIDPNWKSGTSGFDVFISAGTDETARM